MPLIHIKSLPLASEFDTSAVLEELCRDFSAATGIAIQYVTVTWEYLPPGHYAVAGKAERQQPRDSHPVLVDLLTPDFHSTTRVETMVRAIAACIAARTPVDIGNIFVNHRRAHSGGVFGNGDLVRW
jgi:phenylpyruvate tautomerase PptA (4-oxalocrotonate tautomerase family)